MELGPSMNNIDSKSTLDSPTGNIRKLASVVPGISQDGDLNENRIIIHESEPPTAHFQRNGLATPDCLPLPSMKALAENRIPSHGTNTPYSTPLNGPDIDLASSFSQSYNCLPTLTLPTTSISTLNHLTGGSLDPFISHSKEALTTVSYSSKAQMSTGFQRSETLELPEKEPTIVPYLWERVIEQGSVIYISPSKVRLKSLAELKSYLLSDETCKCGLECPFHMDQVFNFDADTPSQPWKLADLEQLRKVTLRSCCHSDHIRSHSLAATCLLLPKLTPPKRKANKQTNKSSSRTSVDKIEKKTNIKNRNIKRTIKSEYSTSNKNESSQDYNSHGRSSPSSIDERPLPPVASLTSLQPGLISPTARLQQDPILSPQQAIARLQDSNILSPHHAGIPTSTLISPGGLLSPGRPPNSAQPHPTPGLPPVGHLMRSHQNTHEEFMMMGGMAAQPGFYPPHPSYMRPITPHNDLLPLHRMPHNPNAPRMYTDGMPGYNMPDFMQNPGGMWAAPGYPAPSPHVGDFSHPPNINMNPHLPSALAFSGPVWHATSQKHEQQTPPRKRKRHRSSASSTSNTGEQTAQIPASQAAPPGGSTPISVIRQAPDRLNSQSASQDTKNNHSELLVSPNNQTEPTVIRSNSRSDSQSTSQDKPSDAAPPIKEELRSPSSNTSRSDQTTPLQLTSKSTPTSPPYAPLPSMQRMLYGTPPVFNHQSHPQQPPQLVRLPPMSLYYNKTPVSNEHGKDLTAKTSTTQPIVNGEKSRPASGSSNEPKNTTPDHFNPAQAMIPPSGGHFAGPNGQPHPGMLMRGMAPRPFMMRAMDGQMYFRYTSPGFEPPGYPMQIQMPMCPPGYSPSPMINGHRMLSPGPAPSQKKRRKKTKDTSAEGESSGLSNMVTISSPAGSLKAEDLSMKGPNKPNQSSASDVIKAAAASVVASEPPNPLPAATCS